MHRTMRKHAAAVRAYHALPRQLTNFDVIDVRIDADAFVAFTQIDPDALDHDRRLIEAHREIEREDEDEFVTTLIGYHAR